MSSDDWEKQLNAELKRGIEIGRKQGALEELKELRLFVRNREKAIVNWKHYSNLQKMIKQVETNKIIKEIDNRINKLKEVVGVLKE